MDTAASRWAADNEIEVKIFPADWEKYGRSAGMICNKEMAKYCLSCNQPTFVLAFPHTRLLSLGTEGMIQTCRSSGLDVTLFPVPSQE